MTDSVTLGGDTPIQVVLEVPDQESLVSVLELISDAGVAAQTEQITRPEADQEMTVAIDLGMLTAKQRETLALALEEGYYERPREADLSTLADRLSITKSAVSQRLRTAEIKLVESALERYTPPR
jgi:predicted DNA binding protein